MKKIKKGDEVIVITGKDKGKRGKVLSVENDKMLVEGINVVKKNVRANPNAGVEGGITTKTMPIDSSNVMMYDSVQQKGSRVGIRTLDDGRKVRFLKSNDQVIDV